jgi:uncharacterized BrkB/YihY/UPF0761 family membrane protein
VRSRVAIARKLGRVLPEAIERFFADQGPQQAAGIAYRILFSIAPLAIVLVSSGSSSRTTASATTS